MACPRPKWKDEMAGNAARREGLKAKLTAADAPPPPGTLASETLRSPIDATIVLTRTGANCKSS